ncbi:uncharacterized protein BKA78DRAFT_352671 [Phyllosticta capitalensis]|uniref:uncharacterized protein n=1 Tax=Phyllosticta capitalensis TaxID=121624 RepID=UPI003130A369
MAQKRKRNASEPAAKLSKKKKIGEEKNGAIEHASTSEVTKVHYSNTTETDGFVYPEPTIWEKSYSYNYALALPAKQAGEQRELIQSQAIGPSAKEQEGTEDTGGDRSAASKRRLGLESTKIEAYWP